MNQMNNDEKNPSIIFQQLDELRQYEYKFDDEETEEVSVFCWLVEWCSTGMFRQFESSLRTIQKLKREAAKMEEAFSETELGGVKPLVDIALKRLGDMDEINKQMNDADELVEKVQKLAYTWSNRLGTIERDLDEIRRCFRCAVRKKELVEGQNA
jgi:hypothetical protein